ncbi:small integral membrane protein 26 [Microcebus murinus]|uniref:small integral membrane protein 26 n=1 Tax=Microcebus murinus TaxID=30608 RepID=UPI003F6AA78D
MGTKIYASQSEARGHLPDYTPQDAPGPEQEATAGGRLLIGGGGGDAALWQETRLRRGPARTQAFARVPMRPTQASAWYRRMSAVYAVGIWTLLGSVYLMNRKKDKPPGDEVEQKDVSTNELLEPPKGFYVETVVTYREDFVPVAEKILNYLKSWTGGPGPES